MSLLRYIFQTLIKLLNLICTKIFAYLPTINILAPQKGHWSSKFKTKKHSYFSIHDTDFVKDLFMKEDRTTLYFEDDFNFKLILHERDFVPGVTILANIVDAIKHSRRMIMILSR